MYGFFTILICYDIIQELYLFFIAGGIWENWILALEWYYTPRYILRILVAIISVVLFILSYLKASTDISRRKMKWIVIGISIGVLPTIIYSITAIFINISAIKMINTLLTFSQLIIPVPFALSVLIKNNHNET